MTFDEFVKKYNGKAVDFDGSAGVQCVDLVDQYLKDVFGITGVWVTGAKDFYNKFKNYPALVTVFDRIPNTRELVDHTGDIVIWGGGTWGHCGIADGCGNIDIFYTYEENTLGRHEPTHRVEHRYAGKTGVDCDTPVLGVLRPKPKYEPMLYKIYDKYRVIDKTGMNIRTGAGIGYQAVGCIPYGDEFIITDKIYDGYNNWGKILHSQNWICVDAKFCKKI